MGSVVTIPQSAYTSSSNSQEGALGTGIDVQSFVSQIIAADQAPEQIWQSEQSTINTQVTALQTINTDLTNLQTAVNALNDPLGAISATAASVSDPTVLSATTGAGAASGTHTVVVGNLATTSSYYTGYQTSSSSPLSAGSFSLQVGSNAPVTITVGADDTNSTLTELASSINGQGLGVTASVITDAGGSRLLLESNTSGEPGNLTITGDTTGLGFTQNPDQVGTNASITVDGIPISSTSNEVTGAIPGVTLDLLSQSDSAVTVSVQPDTTQMSSAINNFVSSYNQLMSDINTDFAYNSTTQTAGPLSGDTTLQVVQETMLSDLSAVVPAGNSVTSLTQLGISVNNDGTLTVDNAQLQSALSGNVQDVQNFFQSAAGGFAQQFSTDLTNLTDPTSGPVNAEITGLQNTSTDLTNQINDLNTQLSVTQQNLIQQYSQINATLEQLPLLLQEVNAQLGATPSSGG